MRDQLVGRIRSRPDAELGEIIGAVSRIDIGGEWVRLTVRRSALQAGAIEGAEPHASDRSLVVIDLPIRCKVRGGRTWIMPPPGAERQAPRRHDPVLIRALRQAHRLTAAMGWSAVDGSLQGREVMAPANPYERRLCRLAFLAPDLQRQVMEGRQPPAFNLERLIHEPIPLGWDEQRRLYREL